MSNVSAFRNMRWFEALAARQSSPGRRFKAYCIGTSKSGTHSIAKIFSKHYRAAHEPDYEQVINMILDAASGEASESQLTEFVRSRDTRLQLEIECSHPLFYFLDILLREFDEAKFILTIRDCYSWLDSQINNELSYIENKHWKDFGEFKYKSDMVRHPKEEQILARFGLHTLDGYLSAWAFHNSKILATVPQNKLLAVRTQDILSGMARIADFLGLSVRTLDPIGGHSFKGRRKFGLLFKLDEQYLEEKVNQHCRPLMSRYFPEIENFKKWKLAQMQSQESALV